MQASPLTKAVVVLVLCALPGLAAAQSPASSAFTYQGELREAGAPVNGVYDFRFHLYDSAGVEVASWQAVENVSVYDGLFTAAVDFGSSPFNGEARYLGVDVRPDGGSTFTALSPWQELTVVPYALYALNGGGGGGSCLWSESGSAIYFDTGNVGIGTATPAAPLSVEGDAATVISVTNTAGGASGDGLTAETSSLNAAAVFGRNNSPLGATQGVAGRVSSPHGHGVRGQNGAVSGDAIGVFGETGSSAGYGVYGIAPPGGTGVVGFSGSDNRGYLGTSFAGVYGLSQDGYGVRGHSINDWGVFGSVPIGSTQAGVVGAITTSNGSVLWVPKSGVCGSSEDGYGVSGRVDSGYAVYGTHDETGNFGYLGTPTEGAYGQSSRANGYGVHGKTSGNHATATGVYGEATGATYGIGVRGSASNTSGAGVYGYNGGSGFAGDFYATSGTAGRFQNHYGDCVTITHNAHGANTSALSVYSTGTEEPVGLEVTMDASFGRLATFDLNGAGGYLGTAFSIAADNSGTVVEILGEDTVSNGDVLYVRSDGYGSALAAYNSRSSDDAPAVHGYHVSDVANFGVGVKGEGGYKGVDGRAIGGDGTGTKYGVYGYATGGTTNYAGYFSGTLRCTGQLIKGSGTFMIDHPLDPANKYLYHSFVESPDMMNIYNGNVVLDANGEAVVTLPAWFEALNREFRYQLTCIGGFAQVYIAEEIAGNRFKIAGGRPGLKVSWQVTGVRQDPFAEAHRVQVEVDKPADEVGTYLHPEEWGVAPELQVDRVREQRTATRGK